MTFRNTNIVMVILLSGLVAYNQVYHVSIFVYVLLVLCYSLIVFFGTISLSMQFFGPARCRGDQSSNAVALTFDDGPEPEATLQLLEILRINDVKATFFCIGKNVQRNPELAKQIIWEGHLIGNHSFYHGALFDLQRSKNMENEINNTNSTIEKATGCLPRFFRPPYGVSNPMLARAIKNTKMINVGWSIRSFDTATRDKEKLFSRVTRHLKGGDVILFHDRCKLTLDILPEVLAYITKTGLKVEPLDKILREKPYA